MSHERPEDYAEIGDLVEVEHRGLLCGARAYVVSVYEHDRDNLTIALVETKELRCIDRSLVGVVCKKND